MVKISASITAIGFAVLTQAAPSAKERTWKKVAVQAHRGGLGMSTLPRGPPPFPLSGGSGEE